MFQQGLDLLALSGDVCSHLLDYWPWTGNTRVDVVRLPQAKYPESLMILIAPEKWCVLSHE
jgi:hypothetical protein